MEGHRPPRAAVQIQRGKACEADMLALLSCSSSSSSCLKLASPTGTGYPARRKGWIGELLQSAPTVLAALPLGGDEQSHAGESNKTATSFLAGVLLAVVASREEM